VPQVKLYVVGNNPPKELRRRASERVVVTGFVEDVRPYVWNAAVYVVPLYMGGGTRLKVLEAMAMKKPVVATRVGCEGIDVRNRESILIEDEPRAFAEAVIELLHNAALRKSIAEYAYELTMSRYEWSVITAGVDAILDAVLHPDNPLNSLLTRRYEQQETVYP
jgi:glycosyltransferase involved in cell wall biosynthesis